MLEAPKIPLFPLPDVILHPGQVIPLHIFEPRYRQMTRDLLDAAGELILGTVIGDDQKLMNGVAPVQPVAGRGRIESYEELDDGRFIIMVAGLDRVRVSPLESDKPYPMATFDPLEEDDSPLADDLAQSLRTAVEERTGIKPPEPLTDPQFLSLVQLAVPIPIENRYQLFAENSLAKRATWLLEFFRADP